MRALDLCFSSWNSYLVNAVDTFNNLCLFSRLCTFPCAFIPVGQSLWPFLLLLPAVIVSASAACDVVVRSSPFSLFLLRYFVCQHSTIAWQHSSPDRPFLVFLFRFNEMKAVEVFLCSRISFQTTSLANLPFLCAWILYGRPEYCNLLDLIW